MAKTITLTDEQAQAVATALNTPWWKSIEGPLPNVTRLLLAGVEALALLQGIPLPTTDAVQNLDDAAVRNGHETEPVAA